MKRSAFFLSGALLLSIVQYGYGDSIDNLSIKISMLQDTVAALISQSDLDPDVAQDLLDKTNDITQYAQNRIQQDLSELRIAAAVTSVLETADKMLQNMNNVTYHNLLVELKYASRANLIHTLLLSLYPTQLTDQEYYTDPYTEAVGFTLNDYGFHMLFTTVLNALAPTAVGKALYLDSTAPVKLWATRLAVGLAAHYAWLLEKKLVIDQLNEQQQQ